MAYLKRVASSEKRTQTLKKNMVYFYFLNDVQKYFFESKIEKMYKIIET